MLGARITVLRRAERCRALARRSLNRFFSDDPFATAIYTARTAEKAERERQSQLPAEVFEPIAPDQSKGDNGGTGKAGRRSNSGGEPELIDDLGRILYQAKEAEKSWLQSFKDPAPGVFETVGSVGRGDPFEKPRPASEDSFEKALAELRDKEARRLQSTSEFEAAMAAPESHESESPKSKIQDFREEEHRFPILRLPKDPALLKALPTGFHEMSDREQQEELWVVQSEARLGREWDLPDPGKHAPYSNDYPPYSPSKVIGMLHRWRNRAWTPQQWRLARAIASNRSLRLPVLTAQAWLRRHNLLARRRNVELKMERYLGSTEEWKLRLAELENQTGITEADVKQWLWILAPRDGDVQTQRFLKSNCRKPLFLLHLLLAKDRKIQEPATFLGLLRHIKENYVFADRPQDELNHPTYKGQGRAMTWWHFLVFLYRLVWHCREGWPAAMPLLARLAADYISTMRLDSNARAMTGYQARSVVLNKSLQYFAWPARVRPIDHMEHNWAAQRHLLRLAATAEPPLVMDQNGYRSVRAVLIALSKTKGEAKNADRIAKTWPPYRRTLDGIDERRDPEDDLSRSVKAGMLVREAGYNDDIVDRALSALGGSMFDQSPTIQTRSLPPPFFSGPRASQNIYSEWATQIRATRNAREAWMMFENPPEPDIRPTVQVYGEMFEKLYARQVTELPVIRPGDVKEVFPVYDGNLSEFEIARLTPPTPDELYDLMLLQDKIKPSRLCLAVLIRNAPSKMAALRYLSDSPYGAYIDALRMPVTDVDKESLRTLSKIPLDIFNAWIAMLCRLHTRAPREDSLISDPVHTGPVRDPTTPAAPVNTTQEERRAREVSQGGSIPEAIMLVSLFQSQSPAAASRDRLPWHTIMKALAGPKILYSRVGAEFNVLETLMTFLKIYERTTDSKGVDPVAFEALCVMIRKTLKLVTFTPSHEGNLVPRPFIAASKVIEQHLVRAHRYAVKTFAQLTGPVCDRLGGSDDKLKVGAEEHASVEQQQEEGGAAEEWGNEYDGVTAGMLRYNVVGRPVYRYMMALACSGDDREMVRLMDWILDGWDREYIREEAKAAHNLDYHYTMRTIAYFVEAGRQLVEPSEMDRLRRRLEDMRSEKGCTWFWPAEGWQEEQTQAALPELETDLVVIEHWTRLRQMVNFLDPDHQASMSELEPTLPMRLDEGRLDGLAPERGLEIEQEQEQEQTGRIDDSAS